MLQCQRGRNERMTRASRSVLYHEQCPKFWLYKQTFRSFAPRLSLFHLCFSLKFLSWFSHCTCFNFYIFLLSVIPNSWYSSTFLCCLFSCHYIWLNVVPWFLEGQSIRRKSYQDSNTFNTKKATCWWLGICYAAG